MSATPRLPPASDEAPERLDGLHRIGVAARRLGDGVVYRRVGRKKRQPIAPNAGIEQGPRPVRIPQRGGRGEHVEPLEAAGARLGDDGVDFGMTERLVARQPETAQPQLPVLGQPGRHLRQWCRRQRLGQAEANALSVRLELQADCLAGVWANRADRARNILEAGDVEEALNAASAIGDDTLQRQTRGTAVPESFTHGTSAQRQRWFRAGLQSGDPDSCDTFSAEHI